MAERRPRRKTAAPEAADNDEVPIDADAAERLVTLRDWLRYGVSQFSRAQLVFGHGTSTALDEAAYLILHALNLPIDELEPWLDARLTMAERERIAALFNARITTRKPAPYLTNEAWMQGHRFYVDERVIVPRSFIGELMAEGLDDIVGPGQDVDAILDLCTGSGCLAILAALQFPDATVEAADISEDALEVARWNVGDYGLEDQIKLSAGDLFSAVGERRFDLILCNPPYVTDATLARFPPEYAAEPRIAHAGGADGLDLVQRILDQAPTHLTPSGVLVVEIGQARPELEAARPDLPFLWLDTEDSVGEVFAINAEDLEV